MTPSGPGTDAPPAGPTTDATASPAPAPVSSGNAAAPSPSASAPLSSGTAPASPGGAPPARVTPQKSHWIGRSGGIVLLLAAIVLALALILLSYQSFALGSFLASVASSNPPSSESAATTLKNILSASAYAIFIAGFAVLFVGPGNLLVYLQKSRKGSEYAGDGLVLLGRVFLALSVFYAATYLTTIGNSITPSSSSGAIPNVKYTNFIASVEYILILVIIGVIIGIVGRVLLKRPHELERLIPRSDKFERTSRYLGYAATALYVVGVLLDVIIVFEYFSGGISFIPSTEDKANFFGYSVIFLGLGVILGGLRDMFHAWAFAEQPIPETAPVASPTIS